MNTECAQDNLIVAEPLADDFDNIEETWCLLEKLSPEKSYFLSWGWIQAWLLELPESSTVYFVQKSKNNKPVFAFFVGLKTVTRSKLFKIRQLCLNVSGDVEYDNIWLEYNGFLCNTEQYGLDVNEVLRAIPLAWDEFYLPGLDCGGVPYNKLSTLSLPFTFIEDDFAESPYVGLEKVRQAHGEYLSLLSGSTRAQIRRSFRILEESGSVDLEIPSDLDHAFNIYNELVALHQATWEARGESGVFSSGVFCRFHERLIRNRFENGEIQLLRIHAGEETVGCLYSFVWHGRVYFYQCGFNYSFGKKVQPGLVSHVLAVQYNAEQGHDAYDFLAGDARYKKSLATDFNTMAWGRVQRKSLKLTLEEKFRNLACLARR